MAKCKLCRKEIIDGIEYCDDCIDKKDFKDNETYLDGLLNSVKDTSATASDIYKKKNNDSSSDNSFDVSSSITMDLEDLKDFDQFDIREDMDDPIVISNDDLYGDDSSDTKDEVEIESNIDKEFLESDSSKEDSDLDEGDYDSDIFDIINHLDMSADNNLEEVNSENELDQITEVDNKEEEKLEEDFDETASTMEVDHNSLDSELSPENELLNLLNQFNPEEPMGDDIKAISDLLGGIDDMNKMTNEYPEDVGQVFHEALEAVSDLDDFDHGIQQIIPDMDSLQPVELGKKEDKKEDKKQSKEKKKGLFARIFSNVEYDEDDIKKKEAKKAAAEAKKSKKKKDKSKDKSKAQGITEEEGQQVENDQSSDRDNSKQVSKAQLKAEKKKARQAKKEEKKITTITIDEEDEGRINRVGASVVFVFFGALVIFLLVSTNIFSYSLSVRNASNYFERDRYNQAYNEVYGIEIKDEDIELYDKIMTVMFVNKQLNSYNNYYQMKKYPEALDSLLKGLQRYDKYLELGTLLGIKTDLDYVRDQIIAELYNVFSLSEEEALEIINSESQLKYSIAVYDVILENISYYN